jgi:hypothetical protein
MHTYKHTQESISNRPTLKNFLKQIAQLVFKFKRIWILIRSSSNLRKEDKVAGFISLFTSISKYPIDVIVRHVVGAVSKGNYQLSHVLTYVLLSEMYDGMKTFMYELLFRVVSDQRLIIFYWLLETLRSAFILYEG